MSGILDFIKDQITPDTINRISTEIGEHHAGGRVDLEPVDREGDRVRRRPRHSWPLG